MCQSKAEGGQRCDCDSSPQRRMRRKASSLRTEGQGSQAPLDENRTSVSEIQFESFEELKQAIASLKKEIRNAPTDPVERSAYDERMEIKMTSIGMAIAKEAETLAGYDEEAIAEQIAEKTRGFEKEFKRDEKILNASKNDTSFDNHQIVKEDIEKARRHYNEYIHNAKQEIFTEVNKKLSESYMQVISQIRPTGGEVKVDPKSNAGSVELFNSTVAENYPTEWIEMHNNFGGLPMILRIPIEDGRAKYVRGYNKNDIQFKNYTFKNLSEDAISKYKNAFGEKFEEVEYFKKPDGIENAYRISFDGKEEFSSREPLIKRGWEYRATCAVINTNKYLNVDGTPAAIDMLVKPVWVKRNNKTKQPELNVFPMNAMRQIYDSKTVDVEAEGAGIMYHEFGHRIEHVFPDNLLARQEKAFLKRRTGKTDTNFHNNLHYVPTIERGTLPPELYHNGNFVTQYTGREYYDPDEISYEVFTTGIQALYAYRYGGLLGYDADYPHADKDHRAFTLGALATL
jgi:hypothetical protein